VLRDAPRPIVVVPPREFPEGPVVIAYDGSLQAARALAAFEATGLGKSGEVRITSVAPTAEEAARHAQRARIFLSHHKIEAVEHVLRSAGPPEEAILDLVVRLNAALLVMGACGQPVLREYFVGSVTRNVLQECRTGLSVSLGRALAHGRPI
jgi:nucleotide-binding universal stress UspA family protein